MGQNASTASCTKCFGSARRLRIAFRSTAFSPKSDARTRAHSKGPATAGRNTTGENLHKLRKLSSIVVRISRIPRLSFRAKSRNLSILFSDTAAWPLAHDYRSLALLYTGGGRG